MLILVGRSAPQTSLKNAICGAGCLRWIKHRHHDQFITKLCIHSRSEINKIFTLENTYSNMNKTCSLRLLTPFSQEIIQINLRSWSVSNLAVISLGCVTALSAAAVVNAASCVHVSLLFLILTKSWNGSLGWEMKSIGSFSTYPRSILISELF